jgi:phage I-like protein
MQTQLLRPLLNREFKLPDDGVYQFAPIGEYPIVDPVSKNRVIQVVDAEAVSAMAAEIAKAKAKPNWPGLLVDREHFSYDNNKESRAAGWVNDAEARADGLFGPIRFTNTGRSDVEGGEYRFLSPVFDRKSAVHLGGNRYRVVKLLGLALTNVPNIRDIQALTNRAEEFHGREATTETTTQKTKMKERLIALLGLAASLTDDQLVNEVATLKNRAGEADVFKNKITTLEGQVTTLTTENAGLKTAKDALLNTAVDRALDEYKGVITAESQEAWKNNLRSNFDGTLALLKGIKPAAAAGKTPVHQPGKAAAAAAKAPVVTGGEDEGTAPFLNRVSEYKAAHKDVSEADAMVAVARENPALYADYSAALAPRR